MSGFLWTPKEQLKSDPRSVGLIQVAYPILLESLLRTTVSMIDVLFLSRVSDSVVSAVSVAGQYIMLCMILASSVASGTLVCINQALGMKNLRKVNQYASIAVVTNTLLGILLGVSFLCFSGFFLKIMTLDAEAMAASEVYMRIYGGMMVFQCTEIIFSGICRSMGHTKAPLLINLISNLINVGGNYVAVFHPEILGFSQVAGVALASVLSHFAAMLIAMFIAFKAGVRIGPRYLRPFPAADFKLALSIGIPGGLNNIAYSASQLVTTSIISLTGTAMVAAKTYVSNLVRYVALAGMSFSSASSLLVGYRIGAGKFDEANQIRSLVTKVAVGSNLLFSLILLLFRVPLLGFFTKDTAIITVAANIFLIDVAVEIGRALNNSIAGALQAAGDVKFQLVVNQASAWLISVGGSYVFGILLGWGLYGVWLSFALDEMTRGLILLYRWRSQKWVAQAELRRKVIAS